MCVSRYHQECKLQLETKLAELTRWEGQLRAGHAQQAAVQTELQRAREQATEERARREGVEGSLHEATRHLVELQRQKENTQQAIEKVHVALSLHPQGSWDHPLNRAPFIDLVWSCLVWCALLCRCQTTVS